MPISTYFAWLEVIQKTRVVPRSMRSNRSKVGPRVFSKPDDNTGTRRGKLCGGMQAGFAVVEFGGGKGKSDT
jgi:hypothetical protein